MRLSKARSLILGGTAVFNRASADSDVKSSPPLSAFVCLSQRLPNGVAVHVEDNTIGSIKLFNQSLNDILRGCGYGECVCVCVFAIRSASLCSPATVEPKLRWGFGGCVGGEAE